MQGILDVKAILDPFFQLKESNKRKQRYFAYGRGTKKVCFQNQVILKVPVLVGLSGIVYMNYVSCNKEESAHHNSYAAVDFREI